VRLQLISDHRQGGLELPDLLSELVYLAVRGQPDHFYRFRV
jgi:hypothetical protein